MSRQPLGLPSVARIAGFLLVLFSASASGQVLIKVSDTVNFRLGVLVQGQADWLQDSVTGGYSQNLFLRRARLLFGGQVAKNVSFFAETDSVNLGKTLPSGKNIQPSVILQDVFAEYKVVDAFALDVGLMFIPLSRNGLQSAASLLPIDYGANTFNQGGPTQSSVGRDVGFQAKGYFLDNHLEYRVGAFQGFRDAKSRNAFRSAGRIQYNFFDPEVGFFYTGTYLGKKKILLVGGGFDVQKDYKAYDGDIFFDYPLGPGAITTQFDYVHFDGGTFLTNLPKQNDILFELGYFVTSLKLTPVVQIANRNVSGTNTGDETRYSLGVNYWLAGHNANIKAAYMRIDPKGSRKLNEFTVQLQLFYY